MENINQWKKRNKSKKNDIDQWKRMEIWNNFKVHRR